MKWIVMLAILVAGCTSSDSAEHEKKASPPIPPPHWFDTSVKVKDDDRVQSIYRIENDEAICYVNYYDKFMSCHWKAQK